jgi:hypothetical protein
VVCPADQAFKVAHLMALEKQLDKTTTPGQVEALRASSRQRRGNWLTSKSNGACFKNISGFKVRT